MRLIVVHGHWNKAINSGANPGKRRALCGGEMVIYPCGQDFPGVGVMRLPEALLLRLKARRMRNPLGETACSIPDNAPLPGRGFRNRLSINPKFR